MGKIQTVIYSVGKKTSPIVFSIKDLQPDQVIVSFRLILLIKMMKLDKYFPNYHTLDP